MDLPRAKTLSDATRDPPIRELPRPGKGLRSFSRGSAIRTGRRRRSLGPAGRRSRLPAQYFLSDVATPSAGATSNPLVQSRVCGQPPPSLDAATAHGTGISERRVAGLPFGDAKPARRSDGSTAEVPPGCCEQAARPIQPTNMDTARIWDAHIDPVSPFGRYPLPRGWDRPGPTNAVFKPRESHTTILTSHQGDSSRLTEIPRKRRVPDAHHRA